MNVSVAKKFEFRSPSVSTLVRSKFALLNTTECQIALSKFLEAPALFAIPVVNADNMPVGILERTFFTEFFIKPFTKELYAKKTIEFLMNTQPIVVDLHTSLEDISRIIIDAGEDYLMSGFLITAEEKYVGTGSVHDLLAELTKLKQQNLFYLAHVDQLTTLPNRLLLNDRLEMALLEAKRKNSIVGLLYIDLDNFKHFNDTLGHNFGDQLLMAFANRLSECTRETDTVARLSGDEFVVLVDDVVAEYVIENLCQRILLAIKEPLDIGHQPTFISASVGYAICHGTEETASSLMLKADAAMYEAKRFGKNNYKAYKADMATHDLKDVQFLNQLRSAVKNNELLLFYQPQIDTNTGELCGKEALIRWNHPEYGILTPIHFIELAEKSGLIMEIGEWVIKTAIQQQGVWMQAPFNDKTPVSVNISATQLFKNDFCEMVERYAQANGLPHAQLCFELTESMFMQDVEGAIKVMQKLKDKGYSVAIDDFGTGYSNLSYLKKFPIDLLKIDQVFVRNAHLDQVNAEIIKAIVAIGKAMSLDLVAEGVETAEELKLLQQFGCNNVQGYYYAKPLAVTDFNALQFEHA